MLFLPLLFFFISSLDASSKDEQAPESSPSFLHKVPEETLYFGLGAAFKAGSLLAHLGENIDSVSPKHSPIAKECVLFSSLFSSLSERFFMQKGKDAPFQTVSSFTKKIPYSQASWNSNQVDLSKIPVFSKNEKELLLFLENRFLAKATGFIPSFIDWVYPCFGLTMQVHPETSGSYARSPMIHISKTYEKRVKHWKTLLPHPENFPLVLTRPFDLERYLPSYFKVTEDTDVHILAKELYESVNKTSNKVIVDFTPLFFKQTSCSKKWIQSWDSYQRSFIRACKELNVDLRQVICVERVQDNSIGGLRILPLFFFNSKEIESQHQFLIKWLSTFGLSANRIELDRSPHLLKNPAPLKEKSYKPLPLLSKRSFEAFLKAFEDNWTTTHPQKNIMVGGAVSCLNGLLQNLSEKDWDEIAKSDTHLNICKLSFSKIKDELKILNHNADSLSFFDTASHIEQIYSHLSTLLELFSPYSFQDFPAVCQKVITSIPDSLKPFTSYALHPSAMTTLAGVFKSAEKALGRAPQILYGDNTYFECINAANLISQSNSIETASESHLRDADIFLTQFSPVWKGLSPDKQEYKNEKVAESLKKILKSRKDKPLTLAIDSTFDFINSEQVSKLLIEFSNEIQSGVLNIINYRSGLKFDLFGMDNYCGAPFYMINNHDFQWDSFSSLLNDPVLQTDPLSLNWFCLAYEHANQYLEAYRKQIFENTRALLDKLPFSIFSDKNSRYRVTPVEKGSNISFLDISVTGPFHRLRTEALITGYFAVKCLEKGFPLFFRISIGLFHTNLTKLSDKERSAARLTVGLDPAQIDVLAECLKKINELNDPLDK
jgi:hypothetical protein